MPAQLPRTFSAWADGTLRARASLRSLVSGLSTASSQSPRCCSSLRPRLYGPGLASPSCSQLSLSSLCHRKALPLLSQGVPALTSIRYYNSRLDQQVIIGNVCFIFIAIFHMHFQFQPMGGGINDSKSITMQNHAIIKMNSACRDYISMSQMWGIFKWYMIFCYFL